MNSQKDTINIDSYANILYMMMGTVRLDIQFMSHLHLSLKEYLKRKRNHDLI